jgi:hypothetical protein
MAENIGKLLQGDLKQMSKAARRKCEASYSWEKTFVRLFEMYEATHRGAPPPAGPAIRTSDASARPETTRRIAS